MFAGKATKPDAEDAEIEGRRLPPGRDALVVADPPRSMLATAGRGVRVERGAGDPYRWLEAELPGLGYEQDLVHAAVQPSGDSGHRSSGRDLGPPTGQTP